jgi:tetratricopeptide (TPR) repeat protein
MQNIDLKKIAFFLAVCLTLSHLAYSQDFKTLLAQADTLFNQQQYTQALGIYEQVFAQTGKSSPAMLLKMAYVEEGKGNYTRALYLLSVYYIQKPNLQAVHKMKEIAAAYNLQGYELKDMDFFMILYQRYYTYFTLALLLVCFIWLASLVVRKIRREYLPVRHLIGCMLFLVVALLFLNVKKSDQRAIISRDNVYLMSAPSAGAALIYIAQKGHRLDVQEEQDIWVKVLWNGKPAFIRKQNVWFIE